MPKPVKKTAQGYIYEKKQIDQWLSKGVEKEKTGRKPGARQRKMSNSNSDFDIWNIRKNKEPIEYSKEMSNIIRFLQPGLKNRNIGNALGA